MNTDMDDTMHAVRDTDTHIGIYRLMLEARIFEQSAYQMVSIIAEEAFYDLDQPIVRITTDRVPLPSADILEDATIPSTERIVATVEKTIE